MTPKREAIRDCFDVNPDVPPSPDAILNALHQAGWAIVPRERVERAEAALERIATGHYGAELCAKYAREAMPDHPTGGPR